MTIVKNDLQVSTILNTNINMSKQPLELCQLNLLSSPTMIKQSELPTITCKCQAGMATEQVEMRSTATTSAIEYKSDKTANIIFLAELKQMYQV